MAKETKGVTGDIVWQSRKGVDEKMIYTLIDRQEHLDMATGFKIAGIVRKAKPNNVGQYIFHASEWQEQENKVFQANVADIANAMCPEGKPMYWQLKEEELKLVGSIHPATIPPDPKREVLDLKAKNNAAEARIAELEAMLEKAKK